jgi:hypothetical protein
MPNDIIDSRKAACNLSLFMTEDDCSLSVTHLSVTFFCMNRDKNSKINSQRSA